MEDHAHRAASRSAATTGADEHVADHAGSASARVLAFVDRWRWWLFGVVVVLHASGFTGRWRPGFDSAEFLILGRRLRGHGDLKTVGGEAEGVMPGYPWLLSWLGGDPVGPALVVNAAAVVLWLVFTFVFVRRVCGRPTAVLVTLLCGASARAMEAGADVLPGTLFAACVAGVLWVEAWKNRWVVKTLLLLGLLLAATTLRSVGVLVALALGLSWVVSSFMERDKLGGRQLAGVFVFLALVAVAFAGFPSLRGDVGVLLSKFGADGLTGVLWSSWEAVRAAVPEALLGLDATVYVGPGLGLVALLAGVALMRRRVFWGVLVLVMALPWFLFAATPRYVVPVLPLLWLGLWVGLEKMERCWPGPASGWAVFAALFLAFGANFVGIGRLAVEQRHEPFLAGFRDGKYVPAAEAGAWLEAHAPPGARVLVTRHERPALTWWGGRAAVGRVSTPAVNAGVLYAVEPLDEAAHEAMVGLGWTLGPVLLETRAGDDGVAWTLHEVDRGADLPGGPER